MAFRNAGSYGDNRNSPGPTCTRCTVPPARTPNSRTTSLGSVTANHPPCLRNFTVITIVRAYATKVLLSIAQQYLDPLLPQPPQQPRLHPRRHHHHAVRLHFSQHFGIAMQRRAQLAVAHGDADLSHRT